MAAIYTAEEILEIAGGRLAGGNLELEAGAISTDTRQIKEGDWFVALEGQKYDGHDFLGDAFAAGAIGAIVAERTGYAIGSHSFPLIAVEAPGAALACLARNWRRRISPQTIVVSGDSSESTSLIDLMQAAALAQSLEVACLPNCSRAREAAELVLNMSEGNKVLIVGLSPSDLCEVENAAIALEANILSFLPLAFENFRLTSDPRALKSAKVSLMRNLNKMWGWVLAPSSVDGAELATVEIKGTLLTCPEKFFGSSQWQKRANTFGASLAEDYEKTIKMVSNRLDDQQAWLATTACALAGIAPSSIVCE